MNFKIDSVVLKKLGKVWKMNSMKFDVFDLFLENEHLAGYI